MMNSKRCRFLAYTMETNTLAKAHRTPRPVQRIAIGPALMLRGKRESQVKLETVLVSGDDKRGWVWNVRTSAGYLSQ